MSIAQIVSLVVNVLFVLFLLFGFLSGLKRGWKKALLRLGVLLVFYILGSIISPYITKLLLNIQIADPAGGGQVTLFAFVENLLYQQEQLANLVTKSPELAELIKSLIVVVCNIVVFMVLMLVVRFISWIVFAIVAKFAIKDKKNYDMKLNKDAQTQTSFDLVPVQPKKRRLIGGAIGLVQGFVLALVFFLPISGIAGTFKELYQTEAVSASSASYASTPLADGTNTSATGFENMPETFSLLIRQSVPQEILDAVDAYNNSAVRAVGGIGDFDLKCFDSITSFKNNGQKIVLRKELLNVKNVYNDAQFIFKLDFNNIDLKTFDYDRAVKAVNSLFDFGLLKAVLPEVVPYFTNLILDDNNQNIPAEYKTEIKAAANDIIAGWGNGDVFADNLKSDLLAILGIAKELGENGVIDCLMGETIDVEALVNILIKADDKGDTVLDRCIESLFSSKTIKIGLVAGLNIGLNEAEDELGENVVLGDITYSDGMWNNVTQESKIFTKSLISSYNIYKNLSTEEKEVVGKVFSGEINKDNLNKVLELNYNDFLSNIGKSLDVIKNSSVFKLQNDNSIFKNLMSALETSDKTENVRQYIDFDALKNNLNFETEFTNFGEILTTFKNSGLSNYIFDAKTNFNEIISILNTRTDLLNNNSKKYLNALVEPVLNSALTKGVLNLGVEKFNEFFSNYIGEGATQLDSTKSKEIANEIVNIAGDLINTLTSFDAKSLVNGTAIKDIIKQENFTNCFDGLGMTFDNLKNSSNFVGVYKDLINKYKDVENISKFINLNATLDGNYSWQTDLSGIKSTIDYLVEYGIVDEMFAESVNIQNILSKFKANPGDETFVPLQVGHIFGPLIQSKILSKSIIFVMNMMNEQINTTLSLAGENRIENLPENIDVSQQKEDIIALLEKFIPISNDLLSGSFSIQNIDLVKMGSLMDRMKEGIYNTNGTEKYTFVEGGITKDGAVFKMTYVAIVDYLKSLTTILKGDVTYGQKITEILAGYGENAYSVDWTGLLEIVETVKGIAGGDSEITPENLSKVLTNVGENVALQNEVKSALKDMVGSSDPQLTTAINDMTFDDTTIGVAEAIASAATEIADTESVKTDGEIVSDLVSSLNTIVESDPENADAKINNLVTIANGAVGNAVDMSTSGNVSQIQSSVERLNVDNTTKDNIYALLGISVPSRG